MRGSLVGAGNEDEEFKLWFALLLAIAGEPEAAFIEPKLILGRDAGAVGAPFGI